MLKKLLLVALILSSSLMAKDMLKDYIESKYKINFDKNTTSLMRKIKVYKYPSWVSQITLTNGKILYFCSPKSMIEFYNQPGLRPDVGIKSENDFKEILVTDFATLKPVNAKGAFFVYGSNKISPAGDDLVPFDSFEKAEKFAKEHNGKRVMSFYEIPAALISLLNGKI